MQCLIAIFFLLLSDAQSYETDSEVFENRMPSELYPWHPVTGPYGDRVKPLSGKQPKYDDDKFVSFVQEGNVVKPFLPSPYLGGLYTVPYFPYVETYYPPSPPYRYPQNVNFVIRKENKDKDYVKY